MMKLRYCPTTKRLFDVSTGSEPLVAGTRGEQRWREEYHATKPKGSKAGSTDTHIRMRGGPWAGASIRLKENDRKKAGKVIVGASLGPLPSIWFSPEFDGYYELLPDGSEYRWVNPLF